IHDATAVQAKNSTISAVTSPTCAVHGSPCQMPRRSDTTYVSGSTRESARSDGGSDAIGTKSPDAATIGYRINDPTGCANRAFGTTLASRKPRARIANVANISAAANERIGMVPPSG